MEGRALRAYVSSTRICMVRQRWWLIVRGATLFPCANLDDAIHTCRLDKSLLLSRLRP